MGTTLHQPFRFLFAGLLAAVLSSMAAAQWNQTDVNGPRGSSFFGAQVAILSNGNYFVSDPGYDPGGAPGTGAVFLYEGGTNRILSVLTGSSAGDRVGGGGLAELGLDRIVVLSPEWNRTAGAATWMENRAGFFDVVSSRNSVVGARTGNRIGDGGIILLFNRNYLVLSPSWTDGRGTDLGAVTWCDGTGTTVGVVDASNSLVGSRTGDLVGLYGALALRNGNYVVRSPTWSNRGATYAGAATWGKGTGGVAGPISSQNSLIGTQAGDRVGSRIIQLTNSNYVVASQDVSYQGNPRAGAVTWGDGVAGTTGIVSAGNSLIGTTGDEMVGSRITALTNGNYVTATPNWDDPVTGYSDVGAVTWGKGTGGIYGMISPSNSFVGEDKLDRVGSDSLVALSNGNYVFASRFWYKERGAVTWGEGWGGNSHGVISDKNSLVGANSKDHVGSGGVFSLPGGNYAIASPDWDFGVFAADAGAATWGDGTNGTFGLVESSNSVTGDTAGDKVSSNGIRPLLSGNYVVLSPQWQWNGNADVGAATFVLGGGPTSDVVSATNSIKGTQAGDRIGSGGAVFVGSNSYAVSSPYWQSGGVNEDGVGAVTWGDGVNGTTGDVSAANSLVGGARGDRISLGGVTPSASASNNGGFSPLLTDRSMVVVSPYWGSRGVDADGIGAVTWLYGDGPTVGIVDRHNSLIGNIQGDLVGYCGQGCYPINQLPGAQYSVYSSFWDNNGVADAGAVTLAERMGRTAGAIKPTNSVLGQVPGQAQVGGVFFIYPWLTTANQLMVGVPFENKITFIGP